MLWLSKQNSAQPLLLGEIGLRIETPSKKLNITGAKHVFMSKMANAVTPKLKTNSLGNKIHRSLRKQKILTHVHFDFSANQGAETRALLSVTESDFFGEVEGIFFAGLAQLLSFYRKLHDM